jgi:hypothetical protein
MRGAAFRIGKNLGIFKRQGAARSKEMPLSGPMAVIGPAARARQAFGRDPVWLNRITLGSMRFSGK